MLATQPPFGQYFDTNGTPLDNGAIYFGTANVNPLASPVAVFWDAAGTMPAAQPIRTKNGYTVRNGAITPVYLTGEYSVLVRDRRGRQVVYAANSADFSNDSALESSISAAAADLLNTGKTAGKGSALVGFAQGGDNSSVRTAQAKLRDVVSVLDYGAVPDANPTGFAGTDNSVAFQRAIDQAWLARNSVGASDYGGGVYVPTGYYSFASGIKLRPGTYLYGDGVYASCLCAPATFADVRGLVIMTDEDSPYNNVPGYATTLRDLGILGDNPVSTSGVYIIKNGCVLDTLWISGFQNSGIVAAQTDIIVSNVFIEFCTYGITQIPLVWGLQVTNANIGNCANGIYIGNNPRYVLQAATSTTITMPASFNSVTDSIANYVVTIKSGAGVGGVRKITAYNGTTKVATLDAAWGITPAPGDSITIEQGLGSNQLTNIRILQRSAAITPQAAGIIIQGGRRTQITNVDVTQAREGDFTIGGIVLDQAEDVVITNYRAISSNDTRTPNTLHDALLITGSTGITVNGMNASRWRRGIAVDNSSDVLISGAQITESWLNGVAVSGGDRVVLNAVNASDNNFVGFAAYAGGTAYIPGAIVSSGGSYYLCTANTTGNAPPNASFWLQVYPGGILDVNSQANAVHSITGCMANKGAAASQVYGIVTNVTDNGGNTGRTIIGGGSTATANAVADYLFLGRRDYTFTDQAYPSGGTLQSIVAAASITIPPSAANNGYIEVTGNTGISGVTAPGYAGASVTLILKGTPTITDGSNLKLASTLVATADDTLTLVCDGTNWIEIARSVN